MLPNPPSPNFLWFLNETYVYKSNPTQGDYHDVPPFSDQWWVKINSWEIMKGLFLEEQLDERGDWGPLLSSRIPKESDYSWTRHGKMWTFKLLDHLQFFMDQGARGLMLDLPICLSNSLEKLYCSLIFQIPLPTHLHADHHFTLKSPDSPRKWQFKQTGHETFFEDNFHILSVVTSAACRE